MIVLIPLGGIGSRFKGYDSNPKGLIKVDGKEILFHLLDNLNLKKVNYVYIPYNDEYLNLEQVVQERYSDVKFKFKRLKKQTRGAAETILTALLDLDGEDEPIMCLDSDQYYVADVLDMWNESNTIITFNSISEQAQYSYVREQQDQVLEIREKKKISNHACTGGYGFRSYFELRDACMEVIQKKIQSKGEYYTSNVVQLMVEKGKKFTRMNLENRYMYSLGTPQAVKVYNTGCLFDLDGTLVNTDPVYERVWDKILKKYNLCCDEGFFKHFIKGNSDANFLKGLIKDIRQEQIDEISKLKDRYFIEEIEQIDGSILYEGVYKLLDELQNAKIAIVTSCNRVAADYIIRKYDMWKYISVLVASEDVVSHKPSPEPYLKAMQILNLQANKCIIFEDSNSGYLSASKANPRQIYMFNNGTNSELIEKLDVVSISNYSNVDVMQLIQSNNQKENMECSNIKRVLDYLPINSVNYAVNSNLKTGYICDIDKYKVQYFDGTSENIVSKMSNNDNQLSHVAQELNMYDNEIYFYKYISRINLGINVAFYYGDYEKDTRKSLLLEDVTKYNGQFNMDLNKDIRQLLNVVNTIFNLHKKFYFSSESMVIDCMRNLKRINQIQYYKTLITERFGKCMKRNEHIVSKKEAQLLRQAYNNLEENMEKASQFPLSFCHGDYKSPNLFYGVNDEIYVLDWQYIHLNKGVSDIVFLLIESIKFDELKSELVLQYYYNLCKERGMYDSYETYMEDVRVALGIFPLFVIVWFNSEQADTLIDKSFPLIFMKNALKYFDYYMKEL